MHARSFRRAGALSLVVLVVASAALFANAQVNGTSDPNDVDGLMDIRSIDVSGTKPEFLISTFQGWRAKRIWDRGFGIVHIDAKGDEWFEYYALIRSDGGTMKGRLYRDRKNKPDYPVAKLSAWKPSKKSVIVKVPLRHLDMPEERTFIRWYVKTLMTGADCKRVCIDRAPDAGALEYFLVEPTPSPSPSVTLPPTPVPTGSPSPSPSGSPQ